MIYPAFCRFTRQPRNRSLGRCANGRLIAIAPLRHPTVSRQAPSKGNSLAHTLSFEATLNVKDHLGPAAADAAGLCEGREKVAISQGRCKPSAGDFCRCGASSVAEASCGLDDAGSRAPGAA